MGGRDSRRGSVRGGGGRGGYSSRMTSWGERGAVGPSCAHRQARRRRPVCLRGRRRAAGVGLLVAAAMSRPATGGPAGSRGVMSIMPATGGLGGLRRSCRRETALPQVAGTSWRDPARVRYGWAADGPSTALVTAVYRIVTLGVDSAALSEVAVTQRGDGGSEATRRSCCAAERSSRPGGSVDLPWEWV